MDMKALHTARLLLVDDEEVNVELLEHILARAGYTDIVRTTDPRRVLPLFQAHSPDLIVLDLFMPHMDGFAVMAQLAPHIPEEDYLPILVLTADVTRQAREGALSAGARDFLTKPFDQVELLQRITNLLQTRFLYRQLQQQNQALERVYQEARAALTMRDASLSTISHDLGQPLAAIRVAARVMRKQAGGVVTAEATGERAGLVAGINDAVTRMWAMLGELHDLSRLQAGRSLDLVLHPTDLVALVRREAAEHAPGATHHHLTVEAAEPELVGEWDEPRLARVVSNLLTNAIMYSPDGGDIAIGVTRERGNGTRADHAVLVVRDQGVGIPAADLPRVFESFHRGANVAGRFAGAGIGLAGARQIVEQHGGAITITSEERVGTTVTVRLPLE